MATFTITGGGATGISASAGDVKVLTQVIDFTAFTNAAGDVIQCIELPANTYVVTAGIEVMTADTAGNSGTVSLGDGDDTIDVVIATGAIIAIIRVFAIVADYDGLGGSEPQKVTFA